MIDSADDLTPLAAMAIALVTGVFVGKITTDRNLVEECSREEAMEEGRSR